MTGKLVFVAVIALCCAQVLNARILLQYEILRDEFDDIINGALRNASEAINQDVTDTKTNLEDAVASIKKDIVISLETMQSVAMTFTKIVSDFEKSIVAQIEKLLKDAEAKGFNAAMCAVGKVEEAKKIEDDVLEVINKSPKTIAQLGYDLGDGMDKSLKATEDKLNILQNGTSSCIPENPEHSLSEANKIVKCLADEVLEISKRAKKLQLHLTEISLSHPHHHLHAEANGELRDIIDEIINKAMVKAKAAIHNVIENTKSTLDDSEKSIEKIVDAISTGLHNAVDTADNAINGLGDQLVAKIEEALKEAETAGLNITLCAEGKVTEAQQIERDARGNVKQCVATAEKVGDDVKAAFESEVQSVEVSLNKTEAEILSCLPEESNHSLAQAQKIAQCFADQIVIIDQQNRNTLANIAVEVFHANVKVANAITDGVTCINSQVADASTKEKALLDEVNKCINDSKL